MSWKLSPQQPWAGLAPICRPGHRSDQTAGAQVHDGCCDMTDILGELISPGAMSPG